jgi:hypothetical protein
VAVPVRAVAAPDAPPATPTPLALLPPAANTPLWRLVKLGRVPEEAAWWASAAAAVLLPLPPRRPMTPGARDVWGAVRSGASLPPLRGAVRQRQRSVKCQCITINAR